MMPALLVRKSSVAFDLIMTPSATLSVADVPPKRSVGVAPAMPMSSELIATGVASTAGSSVTIYVPGASMHTLAPAPGTPAGLHFAGSVQLPAVPVAQCTSQAGFAVGATAVRAWPSNVAGCGPVESAQAVAPSRRRTAGKVWV